MAVEVMAVVVSAVSYVKDMFFTLLSAMEAEPIIFASMAIAGVCAYFLRPVIEVIQTGSDRAVSEFKGEGRSDGAD